MKQILILVMMLVASFAVKGQRYANHDAINLRAVAEADAGVIYDGKIYYDLSCACFMFRENGVWNRLFELEDGDKTDITVSGDGTIFTIDPLTVTEGKLADGSVSNSKIVDLAVTTAKINNNAVTGSKITDGHVSYVDIQNLDAYSVLGRASGTSGVSASIAATLDGQVLRLVGTTLGFGTVTTAGLTNNSITSDKINDGAVGTIDLADNSVTTAKINNSAVTTAKINANAVTSDKITDGTVSTLDLADLSVTTAKINNNAVTGAQINDGSVGTLDLADLSVTTAKINNSAVTSTQINDGTVGTVDLADNSVTTGKITDGTVGTIDLGNLSVTTAKINTNAVTGDKINDGEVGTVDLADLSVTTAKINNSAVTTTQINNGTILDEDLANSYVKTSAIPTPIAVIEWTPTITLVSNVDAAVINSPWRAIRIGSMIIIGGSIQIDATATGLASVDIEPASSPNWTHADQASGTAVQVIDGLTQGALFADAASDLLRLRVDAVSTSARTFSCTVVYVIP